MRLRTRQQYQRMMQGVFRFTGKWILVDIRATKQLSSRLGITVTRRFGPAHVRNRFKRLVREGFRLTAPHLPLTFDLVVRPRSKAVHASLENIQQELIAATNDCK